MCRRFSWAAIKKEVVQNVKSPRAIHATVWKKYKGNGGHTSDSSQMRKLFWDTDILHFVILYICFPLPEMLTQHIAFGKEHPKIKMMSGTFNELGGL